MRKLLFMQLALAIVFIVLFVTISDPIWLTWTCLACFVLAAYSIWATFKNSIHFFHHKEANVYASPDDRDFLYIQAIEEHGDEAAKKLAEHYLRWEDYKAVEVQRLDRKRVFYTLENFEDEIFETS